MCDDCSLKRGSRHRNINNQGLWDSATTGATTFGFNSLNPPAGSFLAFPSLTVSGVTFTGNAGAPVLVMSDTFCCSTYSRGADTLNSGVAGIITATLPANTTAVGFNLFGVTNGDDAGSLAEKVDIGVDGHTYVVDTATAPNLVFFGITSTAPISDLTITAEQRAPGTAVDLTRFSRGEIAATTPEPGYYWCILGIGLLMLASRLRKSRSKFT
jgi:hypothetical protein